ncbi:tumor protein p53-inducible nuclear protein 2 isoform X3 [Pleurodeles waltl]|uniref:tumor protein p53-inducible nuclear protein 2 isoform X3 n=1 Tax=Pleurodeles waltl TaxID=8319 RepID=UPI0037096F1A
MFQAITSLFFSESSSDGLEEEPKAFVLEEEDDGWLIIDLPGPGPVNVESSPLEDLLIEHPSMSVYVTSNSLVVESAVEPESLEEHSSERHTSRSRVERRATHHPTSIATKAAILEKVSQVCRIQRAKERVERHKLSRKAMQRQNLTREVHQRRAKHLSNFVYQPSQRVYNY